MSTALMTSTGSCDDQGKCEWHATYTDPMTGQQKTARMTSEHGADTAADLEQPSAGRELRAVADQPVAPVLRLPDEALLLLRRVAVHVPGHLDHAACFDAARGAREWTGRSSS